MSDELFPRNRRVKGGGAPMKLNLKFWKKTEHREINVLFLYPNKDINIFQIDATKKLWTNKDETDKTAYIIDETAIYFWKKKPIILYRHGVAAPIIIGEAGEVEYALKADEIKAVIESKAVNDLLTAGDDGMDWTRILAGAAAGLSLLQVLVTFHVIKPGGG